ncbi:MAG: hypothetical protein JWP01_3315 [Myxococcales bacterium]|nr:hypothetical protein [Myxococcales bacterium]
MFAAAFLGAPGVASAGRTQYGWLFGTEVMPERGAELQTWIDEENGREPADYHQTTWGFTALVGVTDKLELSLPVEFVWKKSDLVPGSTSFQQYGIEARYRFVTSDPVDAPPFAPLARLAVKRDVIERNLTVIEADLVASTTTPTGSIHALIDLGVNVGITPGDQEIELRPGAGVSFKVVGDLRLGAEMVSEINLESSAESWVVAGPNLAWSHGRFWLSATFGIGVYHIDTAPRMQWGIAF